METATAISLCYGSLALFTSLLHNIFLLYHIDTFVSIYKIDYKSFWIGETVFLLWNSLNDPLFGWISDRNYLSDNASNSTVITKRIQALSVHGPLLAIAFISIWFQWLPVSLQLIACLCLYDGFLTMVDLHHSALLADLAISSEARTKLSAFNSIFSGIGSLSVFLSYLFWNNSNLEAFRIFCTILAIISFAGFNICCRVLKRYTSTSVTISKKTEIESSSSISSVGSLKIFIKQLARHRNFWLFAILNLLQVFHCHFNSNFFPFFLDVLVGGKLSPGFASLLLGFSFLAPHINNLYFMNLCRRYGTYNVIWFLFLAKLFLSFVMASFGPDQYIFLCIFIACNRIFTEGTCKLLNLVISDLVDEDFVLHNRKQAVSALIFGTSALMAKPGQTIAPLLGIYLLSSMTGKEIFQLDNGQRFKFGSGIGKLEREACFLLLMYIPLICGAIQLILWSLFTLQGSRLKWIKQVRESCGSSIWSRV